jgi:hypothetical protein
MPVRYASASLAIAAVGGLQVCYEVFGGAFPELSPRDLRHERLSSAQFGRVDTSLGEKRRDMVRQQVVGCCLILKSLEVGLVKRGVSHFSGESPQAAGQQQQRDGIVV